jgi:transposase
LLVDTHQGQMTASQREGYFYHEVTSSYADVPQRWLVVFYEPRRQADQQRLDKQIARERDTLDKQLKKLRRQTFNCEQDARQALHQFSQQWSFHEVTGEVGSRERYARAGRPTADSPIITEWVIQATTARDDAAIVSKQQTLGKYIIATNELDATRLSSEALLTLYKGQNISVERGFRFLKDPLFFAHRLFLKKPSRIMALLMVMGLCLLVYALAEHHLRQQLLEQNQTIPDQKGKPTQRPTLRRVFQMFEGIHVLTIIVGHLRRRIVTNVNALHLQIATLLGAPVLKFYLFAEHPL